MKAFSAVLGAGLSNAYGLAQMSRSNKNVSARKKAIRNKVLFAFLMVYILAAFTMYIFPIGMVMNQQGKTEALVPMAISIGMMLTLIVSTLRTPAMFFGCKDFDMLTSMPIPVFTVFMSKFALVYVEMLLYSLCFSIPCAISYGVLARPSVAFYPLFFLAILFAPLLPMAVGTLLAFFLSRIAVGAKFKNFAMIVLSMLLLVGVMVLNITITSTMSDPEALVNSLDTILKAANMHPLSGIFARGTAGLNPLYTLLFIFINTAAAVLIGLTVGRNFLALNTRMNQQTRAAAYKGGREKSSGAVRALVRKEAKYFFSQPNYVMNTGVGGILVFVGAVALVFFKDKVLTQFAPLGIVAGNPLLFAIGMLILLFCTGMTFVSASSISLEGNNLWMLQVIPVKAKTVLYAKVLFCVIVALVPALAAILVISFLNLLTPVQLAVLALTALCCSVFTSLTGITVNLRHAKLDWVNPVTVYKQGTAVLICMAYLFLFCMAYGFAAFSLPVDPVLLALALNAVYVIVSVIQVLWINRNAQKRLLMLSDM